VYVCVCARIRVCASMCGDLSSRFSRRALNSTRIELIISAQVSGNLPISALLSTTSQSCMKPADLTWCLGVALSLIYARAASSTLNSTADVQNSKKMSMEKTRMVIGKCM